MADDIIKSTTIETSPSPSVMPDEEEAHLAIGPMIDQDAEGAEEITTPSVETPPAPVEPPAPAAIASAPTTPTVTVPETPAEPAPRADAQMWQRIQTLQQQLMEERRRAEEKSDRETADAWATNRQTELETEDGLSPERAKVIAYRELQALYLGYQQTKKHQEQIAEAHAKSIVAASIADQFKVPISSLLSYNTPEAMIQAAQSAKSQAGQAARMADLEAQVAALKKAQVPAQQFDNNMGAGVATSRATQLAKYANGGTLSEKELKALFRD